MSRPTSEDGRPERDPHVSETEQTEGCSDVRPVTDAEASALEGLGSGLTPEQWNSFLADDDDATTSSPPQRDRKRADQK